MCDIGREYLKHPERVKDELKLDEIRRAFTESMCLSNLNGITLTGGEPFMRSDIVELYGFFYTKYPNATITIPTNSFNVSLILNKLREMAVKYGVERLYLSISLDGIGEVHDSIRGMKGAFARALELACKAKELFNPAGLTLGFSLTIIKENYDQIWPVYELARSLGVNFSVQIAQMSSIYYMNEGYKTDLSVTELNTIKSQLQKIIKQTSPIQRLIDPHLIYLLNMVEFVKSPIRTWNCYSGTHSCFVNSYGDVFPCIMLSNRIGNIKESSFDEIWLSYQATKIRRMIAGRGCNCWTPCEAIPTITRDPRLSLSGLFKTRI
jgi:MoaA/NifB/PqqE/SkfB family radical SAM enzyme